MELFGYEFDLVRSMFFATVLSFVLWIACVNWQGVNDFTIILLVVSFVLLLITLALGYLEQKREKQFPTIAPAELEKQVIEATAA